MFNLYNEQKFKYCKNYSTGYKWSPLKTKQIEHLYSNKIIILSLGFPLSTMEHLMNETNREAVMKITNCCQN